jgi:KDEL-tailed cysteine endopeptidase
LNLWEWREEVKLGLGQPSHGSAASLHEEPENSSDLPKSVDWREKGAVTAVKDQGQCGSCWSFSASGALEGANFIKNGKLVSISEQHFVDCDDNGDHGCHGGLMDNAFEWAQKNGGVCSEENYPYDAKKGRCNNKGCGDKYATPKSFTDVKENSDEALMSALAKQPVSVAIEADQKEFQLYQSGVFTAPCGISLDHGVLAVGYGTDADSGGDYWIVKNSWGPTWGEDGYIRLARGKSVDQKEGQCGILSGPPSYPEL